MTQIKKIVMEDKFLSLHIAYSFSSGIGSSEASDCITIYKDILCADDYDNGIYKRDAGKIARIK